MSDYTAEQQAYIDRVMEHCRPMFVDDTGRNRSANLLGVSRGWWLIIESLCIQIQRHIDWAQGQHDRTGLGDPVEQVRVQQIKEKFGGLRFYYTGGDEYISGMVRMAENWAAHSCEECGAPGKSRNSGWIRTLCDEHEALRLIADQENYGGDND